MLHRECGVLKYGFAILLTFALTVFAPCVAFADEEDSYSVRVSDCVYDGGEQEPEVEVLYNGVALSDDDYDLAYASNVNAGTAEVVVVLRGDSQETLNTSFQILPADVSLVASVDALPSQICTGSAIEPDPVVKFGETVLRKGVDYELAYENNVNPGMATVLVSGMGNFTGSLQAHFEIKIVPLASLSFSKASVSVVQGKTYQTSLVKAPLDATSTVAYSSSNTAVARVDANGRITAVKPGEVTITAKSSDGVKATCTVTVKLPAVNATAKPNGLGKIQISWSKAANASGYYVYRASSKTGTYWRVANIKGNSTFSFNDSGLTRGKTYYYKVKPYYSANSNCNGAFSSITSAKATVKAPTMNSTVNTSSASTIKVTWSKVTGADGYYVYRKRTSNGSWTRVATVKSGSTLSYTDKNASGVDYYAVAAYDKIGSTTYVSAKSNTITARGLSRATKVTATTVGTLKCKIAWTAVSGATGYQVYYRVGSSGSWTRLATLGKVTSYTAKVGDGKTYAFKVRPIYDSSSGRTYGSFRQVASNYYACSKPGTASALVQVAASQPNGRPSGGNSNIYNGHNGEAWCSYFVSWCARQAGISTSVIPKRPYVPDLKSYYKSRGLWHSYSYTPKAGDLIFYSTYSGGTPVHVGIVTECSGGKVYTKEGNATGGAIVERTRTARSSYVASGWYIVGYASPKY